MDAILLEQNDEYAIQKRYISLESLATMSEQFTDQVAGDRRSLIETTKRKLVPLTPRFYTTTRDATAASRLADARRS